MSKTKDKINTEARGQDYREAIYKNYLSTQLGSTFKSPRKDFSVFYKYYKKNYLSYLPESKNKKILDLGCGAGHFLYFLEKEGYKNYLGVDRSEECIKFCKKLHFQVKKADIFKFLKATGTHYDLIVMNSLLEHFNKEEIFKLLKFIHKNLKSEGRLIIATPNMANPILGIHGRYIAFDHEIGFTEESLREVLKATSFKNIQIIPQDIYIFYYNPINYLAKLSSKILNSLFRILFRLYGRKTTKIFTKNIIAIAEK